MTWVDGVLAFIGGATILWWIEDGLAPLQRIRRLFRRPVRHVVDLPAYAGWGPTGIPPAPEPRPDLWGCGHLCDCTGAPHRMEPPCPDYLRIMAGMDQRQWDAQQHRETSEEAAGSRHNSQGPLVQISWQGGLMVQRPEMLVTIRTERPSPTENARRYSEEGGTW